MKFNKKGISILVNIALILAVTLLALFLTRGWLYGSAKAAESPLKKMLGLESRADLEKQKEMERVSKELLASADSVYTQFTTIVSKCRGIIYNCICGTVDFTKLNNYYLKLTKKGSYQILELLDSNMFPVSEKYRISLGNFGIGAIADLPSNEPVNFKYLLFSKDMITYNKDNFNYDKLRNRMEKVNIEQSTSNTIYFRDITSGLKPCSANDQQFAYIKR